MYVIFCCKEIESLPSNNIFKPASDVAYNNSERIMTIRQPPILPGGWIPFWATNRE